MESYEALFGSPESANKLPSYEIPILRKKYAEEVKCVTEGGRDPWEIINDYSKKIEGDFRDIVI